MDSLHDRFGGRWYRSEIAFDVALAAALTVEMQREVWWQTGTYAFVDRPLSSVILFAVTLSLAWRRQAPLAVAAIVAVGVASQAIITGTYSGDLGPQLAIVVATYSVAAYARPWRAAAGLVLISVGLALRALQDVEPSAVYRGWDAAFWWLLLLVDFGLGLYVRSRRRARGLLRLAHDLEAERAHHARAAVAEERARIARELHDVVAHNVSAAVLHAEAAEELLTRQPERARDSLHTVQRMGREALGEMRTLLTILRADADGQPLESQPRLAQLPALIDRVREAGLPTELTIEGDARIVAPGIELSAYRIVQEALTNVRKHAGDARARVLIRYHFRSLEIDIADDGRGPTASDGAIGHGLIGMRERVASFGGRFAAGSRPEGGFVVHASFPIAPPDR